MNVFSLMRSPARWSVLVLLVLPLGCAKAPPADRRLTAYGAYPYETIHAGTALMILEFLRALQSGQQETATAAMEDELDRYAASLLLREGMDDRNREQFLSAIRYIRDYRAQHPHVPSDPEVARQLEAVNSQLE